MQTIINPKQQDWKALLTRPSMDTTNLFDQVKTILEEVRTHGDSAVLKYEALYDKVSLTQLAVTQSEWSAASNLVAPALKEAIQVALHNIECFHAAQRFEPIKVETALGVNCWQKAVPIERVGLYIPGGTAPLFSTVLMLAVPARIAGCKEIVLCTPPNAAGEVHPAILYAAQLAGVNKVFKAGGIQAIGAMTYGTESVPQVYKIMGPGNQYVTAAKQLVSLKDVAIDMPAGPSEVLIIADAAANPAFIAADFLSQAEHGIDSQSMLVTTSSTLVPAVLQAIEEQLNQLPRQDIARKALDHSRIVVLANEREVIDFTNAYAPEHLIIQTDNYTELAEQIVNAGSVFMGQYTPESAGDYASGTNHTLPTNGYAKAYSGVNLDSFTKKITFQEITAAGIKNLGPTIEVMAANELLEAHKNAVTVRLKSL